jgi:hypothetical protein
MHADAEQHLVLDDVADAGEDRLVQKRITDQVSGIAFSLRRASFGSQASFITSARQS